MSSNNPSAPPSPPPPTQTQPQTPKRTAAPSSPVSLPAGVNLNLLAEYRAQQYRDSLASVQANTTTYTIDFLRIVTTTGATTTTLEIVNIVRRDN
ncbi:uncharacterized protein LY89DRAFT_689675 [Mollisia scopiformis]|uniref:Uncharacterized protein n=1 Tax=Mollisia scopiformis TaxID=149040 RepID=A0A132BDE7_MOLSC|nr:uncharacterized protein LY89DRAFT_689675 [Mollisia scopiformis]KUJ10426.1 hypothetical protein LY89DRAFT_689675 [Mollisia scopiformis]